MNVDLFFLFPNEKSTRSYLINILKFYIMFYNVQ